MAIPVAEQRLRARSARAFPLAADGVSVFTSESRKSEGFAAVAAPGGVQTAVTVRRLEMCRLQFVDNT